MLSGSAIRYRRELKPFQAFRLESCILGWRGTSFIMQHRFVVKGKDGEDQTAALALVRGGLYDKKRRLFVGAERLAQAVGYEGDSPNSRPTSKRFSRWKTACGGDNLAPIQQPLQLRLPHGGRFLAVERAEKLALGVHQINRGGVVHRVARGVSTLR